jgi:hypothetical protein
MASTHAACVTIGWQLLEEEPLSDRIDFDVVCPNNHDQTVTFSKEGFEEALKSGSLEFHCNTCDTNWPPTHEEIAHFRREFGKHEE